MTGVGVNWTCGLRDKGTGGVDDGGRTALGKVAAMFSPGLGGLKAMVVALGVLVIAVLMPGVETTVVIELTPVAVMEPVIVMPGVDDAPVPVVACAYALAGANRPSANAEPPTSPRIASIVRPRGGRARY